MKLVLDLYLTGKEGKAGQQSMELVEHEKNLIHAGQKIQAIKAVRERTDCGLYEARQVVQAFIFSNPVIAGEIREKFQTVLKKLGEIRANDDLPVMREVNIKFKNFFSR